MKSVEERNQPHADDRGAAVLDRVTENSEIKQINTKAGTDISYTEFFSWKSKDLIDDN